MLLLSLASGRQSMAVASQRVNARKALNHISGAARRTVLDKDSNLNRYIFAQPCYFAWLVSSGQPVHADRRWQ